MNGCKWVTQLFHWSPGIFHILLHVPNQVLRVCFFLHQHFSCIFPCKLLSVSYPPFLLGLLLVALRKDKWQLQIQTMSIMSWPSNLLVLLYSKKKETNKKLLTVEFPKASFPFMNWHFCRSIWKYLLKANLHHIR